MTGTVEIYANGQPILVASGISVAAALLNAGITDFRVSVSGEPRAPLCGMGICQECRVVINGVPHQRSCLVAVVPGMRVATGD